MPAAGLRVDTSVVGVAGPSSSHGSAHPFRSRTPISPALRSAKSMGRLRSPSPASASASSSTSNPSKALDRALTPRHGDYGTTFGAASSTAYSPTETSSSEGGSDDSEYVLAMHDFVPDRQNVTCLSFNAGQVIRVLNRDPSGWWDGEVDGRRGWFPSNYVTSDVALLTEEELPQILRAVQQKGHMHSVPSASRASVPSPVTPKPNTYNRTDHRPMASESSMDLYCPPIMVPLLHAISLLQTSVRNNRIAHFKPSVACIISCVRSILSEVGCLSRNAPILKQFKILAGERARILTDLASLVPQAGRASEGQIGDAVREQEVETMIRLSGQVFAHVRGFLAVAGQCGINVQLPTQPQGSDRDALDSVARWGSQEGTLVRDDEELMPKRTTNGIERRRKSPVGLSANMRAKSLGDLKAAQSTSRSASPVPPMHTRADGSKSLAGIRPQSTTPGKRSTNGTIMITRHRGGQLSISSISSSSSVSSGESQVGTPPTPVFPTGPSTTAEVVEALRNTHDLYLSKIAAFIGHAHSHTRMSHASSTGHMYDLVREVVEMVCKLLTIVEAVLRHPNIPPQRANDLRNAKDGLYNVTSTLADAVRQLTTSPLPDMSEEEEKGTLLRSATSALRAGAECVNAVKKCLQRPKGERPFIIELPGAGDVDPSSFTPSKFSHANKRAQFLDTGNKLSSLEELYRADDADDDGYIEDLTTRTESVSSGNTSTRITGGSTLSSPEDAYTGACELNPEDKVASPSAIDKPLPPVIMTEEESPSRTTSPVSYMPTDDGTTWDGSHHAMILSDEKLLHSDLPVVPGASPLEQRPDPLSYLVPHDHAPEDAAFNSEGQLVGATLSVLVERMTPHASLVEQAFQAVFFMTFRQFTSPAELVDALIERYNISPQIGLTEDDQIIWQQRKGLPIRARVANVLKTWLEVHWRPQVDNEVLPVLLKFVREALVHMCPAPAQRILELIRQRSVAAERGVDPKLDRSRDPGLSLNPPLSMPPTSEIPVPIMNKALFTHLRSKNYTAISVTDFDATELARQLTLMESNLYCVIQPEEVLETGQSSGVSPVNVRAVTSMSTVITGWVSECILEELDTKKRTALLKFFIKVADRCHELQNFSTPRSILAALDSSTISRLHQTWMGLPQKNRMQLDALRKLADHGRNYHEYRSRLRNTAPPAVPFLGLYLTDITFCREGNPSHRASPKNPEKKLLNFNKYHKLARIVQDMQRFQVPYNLKEVVEVQEYLKDAFEQSKNRTDLQDLYRRSLLLEPKRPADNPPSGDIRQLFGWATRSKSHQATPPSAA